MRHTPPLRRLAVALVVIATAAEGASAATAEQGPWLEALTSTYVVIDMTTGDLDGDGKDETVLCYREDTDRTRQMSGVAVLVGKQPDLKPVFHVQMDTALCEKVRVNGRKLGVLLTSVGAGSRDKKQLVWTYGEEIRFTGDKQAPQTPVEVTASTTADPQHGPEKAVDNDLVTSWAEGAPGTGIGQSIKLRLKKPTDIAAIGILAGAGGGSRAFFDSNRIHRGSIEAKTEADLGDASVGIDFASLGIDSIGDRDEFKCPDKPNITFVHVGKRGVVELQVRVESVYLGTKRDDTNIAEIEVIPLLSLSDTVDRAKTVKTKDEGKATGSKVDDSTKDDAVKKLDESGRSIVSDDGL